MRLSAPLQAIAARVMIETANTFFRGFPPKKPAVTGVVSVIFYVEPLSWSGGIVKQRHFHNEVANPNNRFDSQRDWSLLHYRPTTDHWNKLPGKWIRLVNFPDELGAHGRL